MIPGRYRYTRPDGSQNIVAVSLMGVSFDGNVHPYRIQDLPVPHRLTKVSDSLPLGRCKTRFVLTLGKVDVVITHDEAVALVTQSGLPNPYGIVDNLTVRGDDLVCRMGPVKFNLRPYDGD